MRSYHKPSLTFNCKHGKFKLSFVDRKLLLVDATRIGTYCRYENNNIQMYCKLGRIGKTFHCLRSRESGNVIGVYVQPCLAERNYHHPTKAFTRFLVSEIVPEINRLFCEQETREFMKHSELFIINEEIEMERKILRNMEKKIEQKRKRVSFLTTARAELTGRRSLSEPSFEPY